MNFSYSLFICLVILNGSDSKLDSYQDDSQVDGPVPMPQVYKPSDTHSKLDKKNFEFKLHKGSFTCDVITLAFDRYYKILFQPDAYEINPGKQTIRKVSTKSHQNFTDDYRTLITVFVNVEQACEEYPTLESDETCTYNLAFCLFPIQMKLLLCNIFKDNIEINNSSATINSTTSWGLLRGIFKSISLKYLKVFFF